MKIFFMSVITSIVLVSIFIAVGPIRSISKLETKVESLEAIVTQLEANQTQLASSVNDALSQQTTYLNMVQEQLSGSIQTVADSQSTALSSLDSNIVEMKSLVQNEAVQRAASISSLTDDIDAIEVSIANLSEEMADLTEDSDDDDDDDITAVITSSEDLEIDDGDDYFSGTIVVKVSNETNDDIEDIELEIEFEADEDIPDTYSATLTGGGISWDFIGQDDNRLYFANYSGLDVDEDEYDKFTLTLTVYFDEDVEEDTEFEASVDISNYDS
jgi:exonuclease VII small subunit